MLSVNIRDLGRIDHPILVFGGPYSNLQALEAVLDAAARRQIPADRMICTGDIVAYCADGQACLDVMRAQSIPTIAGNCEKQLAAGAQDCGCGFEDGSVCDLLSVAWYAHAMATIREDARDFMAWLPDRIVFDHHAKRYAVIHGGAGDVSTFLWPTSPDAEFEREIGTLEAQVGKIDYVIAGHSGLPFERTIRTKRWINAGAIGMPPNDGRSQTRYVTLDAGRVAFHALDYDVSAAQAAMQQAGLTQGYDQALETGFWPSEDVLPADLRRVS